MRSKRPAVLALFLIAGFWTIPFAGYPIRWEKGVLAGIAVLETGRCGGTTVAIDPAAARQAARAPEVAGAARRNYALIFITAVLAAAALFNLVLFFGFQRNIAYFFFSLYCLANSLRAGSAPWRAMEMPSAAVQGSGEFPILMYMIATSSVLAYLVTKFSFHKTHKAMSAAVLISPAGVLLAGENPTLEIVHLLSVLVFSLLLAVGAVRLKKENSLFVLVGIAGSNIIAYLGIFGHLSNGYYAGIIFLVICISALSAKEIADQHRRHREAVTRAVRLENELLKRNIQPHYILNTLTTLQEVVDRTPARAAELIQALADEFRLFAQAAGEKFIPLSDELSLCRAHLRIMEFRRGARFDLSVHGVEGTERIPPGIFHTLVENGTTHGYPGRTSGRFTLTKQRGKNGTRYVLFNDSAPGDAGKQVEKGTGMKYIEARLEESYPGAWSLSCRSVDSGWEAVVVIPHEGKEDR